jgi:F-type H+-transporting ATPase subunit b
MHYFLLKMQEKKEMQNNADNQRILQEARMERDNMLKMHVKLDKMIADSKLMKAQGLQMIEQRNSD